MTTRRNFLKTTAAASALVLNPFENIAEPLRVKQAADFKLTILATNWGFPGSWDEYCFKAKSAGYDGCEIWWPLDEAERKKMFDALSKHNLKFGFLWGSGEANFGKHDHQFAEVISAIALAKPLYINCHSGKDFFTADQKSKLITYAKDLSKATGIPIYHETHRGR